jgi:FMN-dependent NADH-azoreductase
LATLLYIAASPRGSFSETRHIADAFLTAYRESNPDDTVTTIDLWEDPLPTFGALAARAKLTLFTGGQHSAEEAEVWHDITRVAQQFASADKYLFSVPTWNLGLPWILKHYLDVITQPGITFAFNRKEGYPPVLLGKKAAGIYASAVYYDGAPRSYSMDFASTHLKELLRLFGVEDMSEIKLQGTAVSPTLDDDRAAALSRARDLGKIF